MADLQHEKVLITVARAKEARECVRRTYAIYLPAYERRSGIDLTES